MTGKIKEFRARWSPLNCISTIFVAGLVLVLFPFLIFREIGRAQPNNEVIYVLTFIACSIFVMLFIAVFFAPIKFGVTDSDIIIKRLGPNVVIPIEGIEDIRRVEKRDVGICLRTFGVGGFCGSYGWFYSFKLGVFWGYLTNVKDLIFIKTSDKQNFLISPEKPDEFLDIVAKLQIT